MIIHNLNFIAMYISIALEHCVHYNMGQCEHLTSSREYHIKLMSVAGEIKFFDVGIAGLVSNSK